MAGRELDRTEKREGRCKMVGRKLKLISAKLLLIFAFAILLLRRKEHYHVKAFFLPPRNCCRSNNVGSYYSSRHPRWRASTILQMGLRVTIRIVGRKTSEQWLEDACDMYLQRLKPSGIEIETIWHKNDAALVKCVSADYDKSAASVVLLDPTGKTHTSEKFADNIYRWLEEGGSRLVFVIGGADGLPPELKYGTTTQRPILLSLSLLTFTHQFARLVLIEQVYRASEIRKGSEYHK